MDTSTNQKNMKPSDIIGRFSNLANIDFNLSISIGQFLISLTGFAIALYLIIFSYSENYKRIDKMEIELKAMEELINSLSLNEKKLDSLKMLNKGIIFDTIVIPKSTLEELNKYNELKKK